MKGNAGSSDVIAVRTLETLKRLRGTIEKLGVGVKLPGLVTTALPSHNCAVTAAHACVSWRNLSINHSWPESC